MRERREGERKEQGRFDNSEDSRDDEMSITFTRIRLKVETANKLFEMQD